MNISNILTIDRSKWRNGRYGSGIDCPQGLTALLNEQGFQCCLGFEMKRCGFTDEDIKRRAIPSGAATLSGKSVEDIKKSIPHLVRYKNFEGLTDMPVTAYLIEINDDTESSDEERELEISKIFKKIGVTVEFVGEYPQIGAC